MALVLKKKDSICSEPFDADGGKLHLVDVIAQREGAPLSAGILEIWHATPVDFDYDNDCAVCFMLEGEIELTEGEERYRFEPGDVVYVPQQEGLVVSWHTRDYGKIAYVTYPHWR